MQKLKCVEGRAHIFSELQSNNSVSFVKSAGGVGMFMENKPPKSYAYTCLFCDCCDILDYNFPMYTVLLPEQNVCICNVYKTQQERPSIRSIFGTTKFHFNEFSGV